MGQRANLIIIEDREYSLYYSHWCANTLPKDLFWGVKHAIEFVRCQRKVDESGWLDDVWGEGAAIIDCDDRVLLLFGGEDLLYDFPLRRVYLDLLRCVWDEWEIRWAHEGIAEIADYVGYPRMNVLSREFEELTADLAPPAERDWTEIVGSFRLADGNLRLYPLSSDLDRYLLSGERIVAECDRQSGAEWLPLDEWMESDFPKGGFHIDTTAKTLEYWAANDIPGIPDRVVAAWEGWKVTWHRDNYEFQLKVTDRKLRFPTRSMQQLQDRVKDILLAESGRSPVEILLELAEEGREKGEEVTISEWALRDDRLELNIVDRQRIVDLAMGTESEYLNVSNRVAELE
jgi:hypothetical protein